MSLSEQELRALREIEQSLMAEDPKFGASVAGHASSRGGGALTLRGVALVVVGILLLLGGVVLAQQSLWFIALSVLGFLVMFGAGVWMLRGGNSEGLELARIKHPSRAGGGHEAKGGLGSRLEDNFRRRFEEN